VACPNLAWDAARGFPSLAFQAAHGLAPDAPERAPLRVLELLAAQVGLLTPVVAWAVVHAFVRGPGSRPGGRLLCAAALLPFAFFLAASLLADPEANWPAPSHPLLLAAAVAFIGREGAPFGLRRATKLAAVAVATSGLVTAACVVHLLHPLAALPADREPAARLRAWNDLPGWLPSADMIADGYDLAAALSFHLPGHPPVRDGRRSGVAGPDRAVVVAAGLGMDEPDLPAWARGSCATPIASHRMRRNDGRVVRTLRGWSVGCP